MRQRNALNRWQSDRNVFFVKPKDIAAAKQMHTIFYFFLPDDTCVEFFLLFYVKMGTTVIILNVASAMHWTLPCIGEENTNLTAYLIMHFVCRITHINLASYNTQRHVTAIPTLCPRHLSSHLLILLFFRKFNFSFLLL